MPIYEYQCQACEAVHETLQKIGDPLLKKCPECGKLKLKKLVSAPSFRLSGTGWYETDFKTDNDKKRNLSSDDSKKESASQESASKENSTKENSSKESASKDSKPETKPESKPEKKTEGKKTVSEASQKTTKKSKKKKA